MEDTRQAKSNLGNRIAFGVLVILVSLFLFLCNIHCFGGVGRMVYGFSVGFFGLAAYAYCLVGIIWGFKIIFDFKIKMHLGKILFLVLMYALAVLALQIYSSSTHFAGAKYGEYLLLCYYNTNTAGGMLFGILSFIMMKALTTVGALVLTCGVFFISLFIQILPLIKKNSSFDVEQKESNRAAGIKSTLFKKKQQTDALYLDDVDYPSITDFSNPSNMVIRLNLKSTQEKLSKKIKGADFYVPLEEIKTKEFSDIQREKVDRQQSFSQNVLAREILFGQAPNDEIMNTYRTSLDPSNAFENTRYSSPQKSQDLRERLGISADDEQIKQDFNEKYNSELAKNEVFEEKKEEVKVEEIIPKQEDKLPENDEGRVDFAALRQQQIDAFAHMYSPKEEVKQEVVEPAKVQTYQDPVKEEEPKQYANTGLSGAFNKATNKIEEEKPIVKEEIVAEAYEEEEKYEPLYSSPSMIDLDRGNYKPQKDTVKMPKAFEQSEVTAEKPASASFSSKQEEKPNIPKPKKKRLDESEKLSQKLENIDATKERVIQPSIDMAIEQAVEEEKKIRPYTFPPLSILREPAPVLETRTDIDVKKEAIRNKMAEFGVEVIAESQTYIQGPTFTLFKFRVILPRGKNINYCLSFEDDMAMALYVQSVRMYLIPEEGCVGIEVPNIQRRAVNIIELINSNEFRDCKSPAIAAFGQDIFGRNKVIPFNSLPHAIVAGATGMGKSCCLNTLIVSILYKASPDEVRLILIDPKRTEFTPYQGLPNLLLDVVKDADKAIKALAWACGEMDRRMKLFESMSIRDIDEYNKAASSGGLKKLPRIIIVIDEFAELISLGKKSVEDSVNKIARLARAQGIHLILATQRPSTDVISGTIKNNFPVRVAFKVSSQFDSRTVLDQQGAENLLPRGDMLFKQTDCERIQGAFISNDEVIDVCKFIKENNDTVYDDAIKDAIEKDDVVEEAPKEKKDVGAGDYPPELFKALEMGIELAQNNEAISISNIQRRLGHLGWPKAARIYDTIDSLGYLEVINPIKPKEKKVTMTREEFEEFKLANHYGDDAEE